jgi:hypothetical protein
MTQTNPIQRELFTKCGSRVYSYIYPVMLPEDEPPSDKLLFNLGISSEHIISKTKTIRAGKPIWLVELD